jgi:sarcosine oxidase subunit delta
MASLIPCPFCGPRPTEEFAPRGDVAGPRPAVDAPFDDWHDYVYLRDNARGRNREHWHHQGGCRRWLIVERDTVTHVVHGVTDARAAALARRDAEEDDSVMFEPGDSVPGGPDTEGGAAP